MASYTTNLEPKMNAAANNLLKMTSSSRTENLIGILDEDEEFIRDFNRVIDDESIKDADPPTLDSYDPYLNMELGMPRGPDHSLANAHLKRRTVDVNNEHIGVAHQNPLLDSHQYEVEYEDSYSETLSVNIITFSSRSIWPSTYFY